MLDHLGRLQLNLGSDCKKNVRLVKVLAISFFGLVSTVLTKFWDLGYFVLGFGQFGNKMNTGSLFS